MQIKWYLSFLKTFTHMEEWHGDCSNGSNVAFNPHPPVEKDSEAQSHWRPFTWGGHNIFVNAGTMQRSLVIAMSLTGCSTCCHLFTAQYLSSVRDYPLHPFQGVFTITNSVRLAKFLCSKVTEEQGDDGESSLNPISPLCIHAGCPKYTAFLRSPLLKGIYMAIVITPTQKGQRSHKCDKKKYH